MGLSTGSLADLLAFDAWPEEMKKIAREAVRHELDNEHEPGDDEVEAAMDDQQAADQAQFKIVHEHLDLIRKLLVPINERLGQHSLDEPEKANGLVIRAHAAMTDALARLKAIPELLSDVEEPTP